MKYGKRNVASDDLPDLRRVAPNSAAQVQVARSERHVLAIDVELDCLNGRRSDHRIILTRPSVVRYRRLKKGRRGRRTRAIIKRPPRYKIQRKPTRSSVVRDHRFNKVRRGRHLARFVAPAPRYRIQRRPTR